VDEFSKQIEARSASGYAGFFMRSVKPGSVILDCGCGPGTITVGLVPGCDNPRAVIGLDRDAAQMRAACEYSRAKGISSVCFLAGDAFGLPFRAGTFDAVLVHSMLEAIAEPLHALREIRRVLKPGGLVGAASVDYGGVVIFPDPTGLLHRFYDTRERLWLADGIGVPRRGRELRTLLSASGFRNVKASARYISYGTADSVGQFGRQRAAECGSPDFVDPVLAHGLAGRETLAAMADAWNRWREEPGAFLAFAWCNALGWK
jgi:SAM-dependent methyltransferase